MFNRKLGRFEIELEIIDAAPEVVRQVMGTVIVVHAEMQYATKSIHYTAISDAFDGVPEGIVPPVYDVEVNPAEGVVWTKQGE